MTNANPMVQGPSVHFENVGLDLGGNTILTGVNFTVESGSIHCIIGPNGGGKTSLIRSLLGQMPHTGDIRICWGNETTTGYVPQSLDFDDTLPMTVVDFMVMACRQRPVFMGLKRDSGTMIRDVLARVGMAEKMNRPFGRLSGGERQRVLLAQALMPRPKLLVLDEPATGLDKSGAAIMYGLLDELSRKGTTVLLIHHDLAVVRDMADTVTCINRRMLFTGKPKVELTSDRILTVFSSARAA